MSDTNLSNAISVSGGAAIPSRTDSDSGKIALLYIFMILLLVPVHPLIGGLRMDPYRILFLFIYIPIIIKLFMGQSGVVTSSDKLVFLYGFWVILSFAVNHGLEHFAYSVVWVMEVSGGYVMGRLLVQNVQDYQRFIRVHVTIVFLMAPFALYEMLTGHMIISEFLGNFLPATPKGDYDRSGYSRVQVVFPHAILFGLYCSIALANLLYYAKKKLFQRLLLVAGVIGVTATALSSAPLLSVLLQSGLTLYDKITKGNWKLLAVLAVIAYIVVSALSNRGPIVLIIETLTLDPQTGWYRINIFNYGIQNVWAHPIFGIGFNDWERPGWLTPSVDNFWLLNAMRNGIPAFLLLFMAVMVHFTRVARAPLADELERHVRTGYMIVLGGIVFVLITVHVWDALNVFIMFYIGAGAFFYTGVARQQPVDTPLPSSINDVSANAETFTASGTRLAQKSIQRTRT